VAGEWGSSSRSKTLIVLELGRNALPMSRGHQRASWYAACPVSHPLAVRLTYFIRHWKKRTPSLLISFFRLLSVVSFLNFFPTERTAVDCPR